MHKLDLSKYRQFSDLNFQEFETQNYSVYVISHDWKYLYVNAFVETHLNRNRKDLLGKNMWIEYPALSVNPAFNTMRQKTEAGLPSNILTNSPVVNKRLNVVGQPLSDCYFFAVSVMPMKDELIDELRLELQRRKTVLSS